MLFARELRRIKQRMQAAYQQAGEPYGPGGLERFAREQGGWLMAFAVRHG